MSFGAWNLVDDGCWERLAGAHFQLPKNACPLEVVAEESGASDESRLVSLDFDVASEELDRDVVGSDGVVVSVLG